MLQIPYPTSYKRNLTKSVQIAHLEVGGNAPILIQSMLVNPASKLDQAIAEMKKLVDVNCQLIRLSLPTHKELEASFRLKERMKTEGLTVPLVADVHFNPSLAIDAAEVFDKIRINPGNFVDSPKGSGKLYSNAEFSEGREKLLEALKPLITNLKKYRRALRIGVNQGSLSERMIFQFGDSPQGMVESALEACELCTQLDYDQIIISLKSSNPIIVNQAYRLLVTRQDADRKFPLHLGVTEAGTGPIARVKSLVGIGSLLRDGIGDTIRVSLAEDSHHEIPVAEEIAKCLSKPQLSASDEQGGDFKRLLGASLFTPGVHRLNGRDITSGAPVLIGYESMQPVADADFIYSHSENQVLVNGETIPIVKDLTKTALKKANHPPSLIVDSVPSLFALRAFFRDTPKDFALGLVAPTLEGDIFFETEFSSILCEGFFDFILLPNALNRHAHASLELYLQASRVKSFAADYIACPSCGRTLFDLQKTTEMIRSKTLHLKGIKIGIMGCIVNGPGEMADAHFGYVGSGPGKIDLYFGQTRVQRGIDESLAVEALIALIKEKNQWYEAK
ncbi:MAG: (E)-4-hydroxy-3-methylbut-2-enyl-diphosphate synthase [SAR324 cluster bacterium]|nr:(E)-4-hydroxy-3-methylbut-2-enyl-diphosphate synthase [SAR324 cluster bacterium]